MPTPITLSQSPHLPFNMAYGPNPVALTGLAASYDKYVLQIFKLGGVDPIADVRQTPNKVGDAIFDIQNILQTIVEPSKANLDALHYSASGFSQQNTRMRIADGEQAQYQLKIGYEAAGVVVVDTVAATYTVVGGMQPYFQEQFPTDLYIPAITGTYNVNLNVCTTLETAARPLSDNQWTIADSATGDAFLTHYTSPGGIDVQNVYAGDQCTKSFYNTVRVTGSLSPVFNVQGIEAYIVAQFNSAGNRIVTNTLVNTQSNGGGPNITLGQGTTPTGNYLINTVASGPANFPIGILSPATTHYYIIPVLYTPQGCVTDPQSQTPLMDQAAWRAQRFNVLPTPCIDYPHVQFAWMNSLGMRDQFTFTKRNERGVKTKKNNFLRELADYNANTYNVTPQSRGFTTFSQTIVETFSADTDYINDEEAKLIEHLFTSPDVMVRFSTGALANQWLSVNMISSNYVEKTNRKNKLFQYNVKFKLANNIKSQRG